MISVITSVSEIAEMKLTKDERLFTQACLKSTSITGRMLSSSLL